MKRIYVFLAYMFIFCSIAIGQIKIPEQKNANDGKEFVFDSSIEKLISQSQAVIMFRIYSAWSSLNFEYRIISYGKDNLWHYHYFMDRNFQDKPELFTLDMPQKIIKKVWQTNLKNNLFSINTETANHDSCSAMIFDSHQYEFIIVANGQYKRVKYYAPEFFEKNCPGNQQRINIINCAKSFKTYCEKPYKVITKNK